MALNKHRGGKTGVAKRVNTGEDQGWPFGSTKI